MIYLSVGITVVIVIAAVLAFFVLCSVIWYIRTMNKIRRMNVKCSEALSGIDVALTKRFDTLTKMLDVTKGYAKHEKETILQVVEMRKPISQASFSEKKEIDSKINAALREVSVVAENYPELKADHLFCQLNDAIYETEERLQASRRVYNANVSLLNQYVVSFPSSIVASRIGIRGREMFVADEIKKQDVKMEF